MSAESSVSKPGAAHPPKEQHQLAGLDPRERGFNRPVEFEYVEGAVGPAFGMKPFASRQPPSPRPMRRSDLWLVSCTNKAIGNSARNGAFVRGNIWAIVNRGSNIPTLCPFPKVGGRA